MEPSQIPSRTRSVPAFLSAEAAVGPCSVGKGPGQCQLPLVMDPIDVGIYIAKQPIRLVGVCWIESSVIIINTC